MIWSFITQLITLVLDLLTLSFAADKTKDLELLVLRQQIRILERRLGKRVRPSRVEKMLLAVTAVRIKKCLGQGQKRFKDSILYSSQRLCSSGMGTWLSVNGHSGRVPGLAGQG
jgi:hypothetical protein